MDCATPEPPESGGAEAGAGLEHAITPARSIIANNLPRRHVIARHITAPTTIACPGSHGSTGPVGAPVLGSETGAAMAKHSVVAFVCVSGAETPMLGASGA